jgi:hypothetical protein
MRQSQRGAEIRGLDSVEVDAAKPAWRSMLQKSKLGFRGSGCRKAGVEVDAAELRPEFEA